MKLGNLRRRTTISNPEHGYLLIAIMVMVALLAIVSLARVKNLATELKRDQEEELVHRGAQYARAVQKFYKKTRQYPVRIEQLENTNNLRFLRKRYKDPVTGGDFRLVRQADLMALQPPNLGAASTQGGSSSAQGSMNSPIANAFMSSANLGGSNQPASLGQNTSTIGGASPAKPDSNFGSSGPTLGGGPFIGVASTSAKVSLKEFDGKNHYKDWLFIYVPALDRPGTASTLIKGPFVRSQAMGGVFGGGAGNVIGTPPVGGSNPSPFGSNAFGSGSSGASGANPVGPANSPK